jgi:hypothetical protein
VGYGPFFLCVIHKEELCPSSGDMNRLMMIMIGNYNILKIIINPSQFTAGHRPPQPTA